jgi:hypothetical protein
MNGVTVAESPIQGVGAFATRPFTSGEVVHEMQGKRIGVARCAVRLATGRLRWDDPLQVGRWTYLHLDHTSMSVNHCCTPNTGLGCEGELVALRDIAVGEEITFDYSLTVPRNMFTKSWRMDCRCGSPNCRKVVGNVETVPADRLEYYRSVGAIQDFMLEILSSRRPTM